VKSSGLVIGDIDDTGLSGKLFGKVKGLGLRETVNCVGSESIIVRDLGDCSGVNVWSSLVVWIAGKASSLKTLGLSAPCSFRKVDASKEEAPPGVEDPKHSSNGFMPSLKIELKKFGVS